MIPEELSKHNQALASLVKDLQGKVETHEKLILLCLDMIKNFGHFIPKQLNGFQEEFKRIRGDANDDKSLSENSITIDTYLDGNPNHPKGLNDE